jgi:hypothetical protein
MAAEICAFVICILLGELREFLSLEPQGFALTAAMAFAGFKRLAKPKGTDEPPGPTHASGCRLCGAQDAVEYTTEYGWYEKVVSDSGNAKETKQTYLPLGATRVPICNACVARELASREARERRIAAAFAFVGVPVLLAAVYLLGGFGGIGLTPGELSADGRGFSWLAAIIAALALLYPALIIALEILDVVFPGVARRTVQEIAQAWSWELVRPEIAAEFEEAAREEWLGGVRITRTAWIGAKMKDAESWERQAARSFPRYRRR